MTEFEEGGMAVGMSCAHMIADPISATVFLKAWADIILNGTLSFPPFFHTLPKSILSFQKGHHEINTHLINHYKSLLGNQSTSLDKKTKTISLHFTHHIVQNCMQVAQLIGPIDSPYSSAFIALVGLLWICISRVKGVTNGLMDISICSNMRKVLGLDQGYFGNCMIYNKVHGDGVEIDDLKLATMAIGDAIGKVNKEGIMDLIEWLEHRDGVSSSLEYGDLIFMNLEDVDPYSITFVEGYQPLRVAYYSESVHDKAEVVVLPSHPDEGHLSRNVMVTLPIDEAIKLCEDNYLASYSPTIVMGAKH